MTSIRKTICNCQRGCKCLWPWIFRSRKWLCGATIIHTEKKEEKFGDI